MAILPPLQRLPALPTKLVFLAALPYAMSFMPPSPPFGDNILTSAREQIEYMLHEDALTALVTADEDVKSEIRRGLSHIFSLFHTHLSQLHLHFPASETAILHNLTSIEWFCNVLPKMNLMTDFVLRWAHMSFNIVRVFEHQNLESSLWTLKLRLIEVTSKVFEAVSYGNVIVPAATKVQLLNTWLPYIQKVKPLFDSLGLVNGMDDDLCQTIQGAIVSMIVTLPSNDQAAILAGWMESQHLHLAYPDLTEAFEIWCYRTKSSKRRLIDGPDRVSTRSPTSSSDLSA